MCSGMDRDLQNRTLIPFGSLSCASTRDNLNVNILFSDVVQKQGELWPELKLKLYKEIRQ